MLRCRGAEGGHPYTRGTDPNMVYCGAPAGAPQVLSFLLRAAVQNGRDERRVGPGGGVLHAIHLLQLVGAVCLEDSLPQDYRMVLASPTSRSFRIIALAGRLVAPATAKHSHTTLGRTRSASPTPSPSAFPYEQELGEERQALVEEPHAAASLPTASGWSSNKLV